MSQNPEKKFILFPFVCSENNIKIIENRTSAFILVILT